MGKLSEINLKEMLAEQVSAPVREKISLKKGMTIPDIVRALEPELKKALPSMLTPERFMRMALSAINNTPKLQECTPMSFIAALLNAAQLGLEPNTPLGQAYLIPYKNKKKDNILECQFQIGYKGMIELAYRNESVQTIQAHAVHENDVFDYEYGLSPALIHRPAFSDKGEITYFYGFFRTMNGGYGFSVMSKYDMDEFASNYSQGFDSSYSPWKTSYEEMAKKTVIKQALKYAPIKTEFQRALSTDETIKSIISEDMTEISNELLPEMAA